MKICKWILIFSYILIFILFVAGQILELVAAGSILLFWNDFAELSIRLVKILSVIIAAIISVVGIVYCGKLLKKEKGITRLAPIGIVLGVIILFAVLHKLFNEFTFYQNFIIKNLFNDNKNPYYIIDSVTEVLMVIAALILSTIVPLIKEENLKSGEIPEADMPKNMQAVDIS